MHWASAYGTVTYNDSRRISSNDFGTITDNNFFRFSACVHFLVGRVQQRFGEARVSFWVQLCLRAHASVSGALRLFQKTSENA